MSPPRSRRDVLRVGGAVATMAGTGSLAGCLGRPINDPASDAAALSAVPSTADAVLTIDVDAVIGDPGVRTIYGAWLEARAQSQGYEGPTTLTGTLDDFEGTEGFDLRELATVTAFATYADGSTEGTEDEFAAILDAGWDESTVLTMVGGENGSYSKSKYGDYTIHEPAEEFRDSIGVLGEDRYVIGGGPAVRAAIDVDRGGTESLDGAVATAYRNTVDGPIRFATAVDERWFPKEVDGRDGTIDLSAATAIETAAGTVYRQGDRRGVRISLNTPDESSASELAGVVEALLTLARTQVEESTTPAYLEALLADVDVEQGGTDVTVTIERTVAELEGIATEFGEGLAGSAGSSATGSASETPQVRFGWEYDGDAGTLTVTHEAGDSVPASELSVRGDGFAAVDGVDMTAGGPWAGETSDEGTVRAGNSVVLGVEPDYSVAIVWRGDDVTAVLAQRDGPNA